MKKCTICKLEKDISEFNKKTTNKDGFQTKCRVCSSIKAKNHYRINILREKKRIYGRRKELKNNFQKYKETLSCSKCSEHDPCCLEFHHLNPKEKDFNISAAVLSGLSWAKVLEEINKCKVLCSNCHRKVHAGKLKLS